MRFIVSSLMVMVGIGLSFHRVVAGLATQHHVQVALLPRLDADERPRAMGLDAELGHDVADGHAAIAQRQHLDQPLADRLARRLRLALGLAGLLRRRPVLGRALGAGSLRGRLGLQGRAGLHSRRDAVGGILLAAAIAVDRPAVAAPVAGAGDVTLVGSAVLERGVLKTGEGADDLDAGGLVVGVGRADVDAGHRGAACWHCRWRPTRLGSAGSRILPAPAATWWRWWLARPVSHPSSGPHRRRVAIWST